MKISTIKAKSVLVKSDLPASDYVANPYSGCPHRCRYCYASFMKRITKHTEKWGTYIDVKEYDPCRLPKSLGGKTILLSSVTDPYNPYEVKFHKSRDILKLLVNSDAHVEILSKSDLMVEDIDLLKEFRDLSVGISLNTLDDGFRKDMEPGAPSVQRRLKALEKLHSAGIPTYLHFTDLPVPDRYPGYPQGNSRKYRQGLLREPQSARLCEERDTRIHRGKISAAP